MNEDIANEDETEREKRERERERSKTGKESTIGRRKQENEKM